MNIQSCLTVEELYRMVRKTARKFNKKAYNIGLTEEDFAHELYLTLMRKKYNPTKLDPEKFVCLVAKRMYIDRIRVQKVRKRLDDVSMDEPISLPNSAARVWDKHNPEITYHDVISDDRKAPIWEIMSRVPNKPMKKPWKGYYDYRDFLCDLALYGQIALAQKLGVSVSMISQMKNKLKTVYRNEALEMSA